MIPQQHRERLTGLAYQSIQFGIQHQRPVPVNTEDWPVELCVTRASFVTLHKYDELRGCIGTLTATLPLVQDIAEHAFDAAFKDPRFGPVTEFELDLLSIHLSVLSPPEPLDFNSETELLGIIRPGIDGLILKERTHQGTFLPSVWEKLPDPKQFLRHLKQKARLSPDYWSDTIQIERYSTESW